MLKTESPSQNMSKIVSERMTKSFLDLFVLSILNGGSRHGYDIMRELKARTGTRIGAGTLYPLLYQLEEGELVSAEWMSPTRRSRRVYKITEKGEKYREQGFRGIDRLLRGKSNSSSLQPFAVRISSHLHT